MDAPRSGAKGVRDALRCVDHVLRGHHTSEAARTGQAATVPVHTLIRLTLALGAVYGASLGMYGLSHGVEGAWKQLVSATIKLPLLFPLTLAVTLPSLYVFGALLGSPLGHAATLRLLLIVGVVNTAVLASLGPVFVFFAASTNSYPFLLLLNVAFAAAGGFVSLVVLRRGLENGFAAANPGERRVARRVLVAWSAVYAAVGAQMGWLLRPFLGAPSEGFAWLRGRESSFFEAVLRTLADLVRG